MFKNFQGYRGSHNNNVLHRDIKPSNIMYNVETKEVKIIDFGTSKIKSIVEQETHYHSILRIFQLQKS